MARRVGLALAVIGLVAAAAGRARADLNFKFDATATSGADPAFHYLLDFNSGGGTSQLETGTGVLSLGADSSQDFATIYNIRGFVAASLSGPASTNLTLKTSAAPVACPTRPEAPGDPAEG